MLVRHTLAALVTAAALLTTAGCAVSRNQESVGSFMDDTAITTAVKSRMLDNKTVDGTSISVETLNGSVMLSGFAKSTAEKTVAEQVTWKVDGVKSVKNQIVVRP